MGESNDGGRGWARVCGCLGGDDGKEPLVGGVPKSMLGAFDQTYMAAPLLQVGG